MNWRSNIDELSSLPGENAPSLTNAWEKLELRLHKEKKPKRTYWYWVAAACLITCFMAVWLKENDTTGNKGQSIVKNTLPAGKKESTAVISNETQSTKKENTIIVITSNKQKQNIEKKITAPAIDKDTTTVVTFIAKNTDSILNIAPTNPTIKEKPIVFNALKKKLPVVHINDIEKPVAPNESVAGNNEHAFKLRLFRRDNSPSSPDQGTDNNGIFKIKIPPQN